MADTATLESGVSQAQSNGAAAASTKPPVEAVNPGDTSAGEVADDELSEVPKTRLDAGEEGDEVDLGEEDEYDFEEEQQVVEGEDDEYAGPYRVDEEDDEYHDEDGEGEGQPEVTNGAPGGKPSLTALLLGNPNDVEEDEEEYNGEDDDEDAEYNVEEEDDDEDGDYMEESTPITPTSKKRGIQEAREDEEDEGEVAVEEGASKKKVKS